MLPSKESQRQADLAHHLMRGVCGSLSGTIGRASHSLISHIKGARSTREVEGQQRLASLLQTTCMSIAAVSSSFEGFGYFCKSSPAIRPTEGPC